MAYGRTYIPRSATLTQPSFNNLRGQKVDRRTVSEAAAAASFLFFIATLVAAMSFLIVVGPPIWGRLS